MPSHYPWLYPLAHPTRTHITVSSSETAKAVGASLHASNFACETATKWRSSFTASPNLSLKTPLSSNLVAFKVSTMGCLTSWRPPSWAHLWTSGQRCTTSPLCQTQTTGHSCLQRCVGTVCIGVCWLHCLPSVVVVHRVRMCCCVCGKVASQEVANQLFVDLDRNVEPFALFCLVFLLKHVGS